ncbi:hypothetical protein Sste5346_003198 [Sporothrix stenoceras]|uniref:Clock-controlled protein 6 n=1 Tax=Sporothrix stenoceras TaxID=5173 RepID=A0ABR3ZDP1_9PEZI
MKFSVASILALATAVSAGQNVTYTTEVVTALTTYCPEATTLTHNGKTYTISSATTLTITDCPCTLTKPVTTATTVSCTTPYNNATVSVTKGTASYTPTQSAVVTAGAGKVMLSGAAGVVALGAAILL